MSLRPSLVLTLLIALGACTGSAPTDTVAAEDTQPASASGAAGFGTGGPGILVEEQQIRELDTDNPVMKVDVRLTPPNYTVVYVKYSTADGSATAGDDYGKVEGTLRFDPGELVKTIEIPVFGDDDKEGIEEFVLLLQLVSKDKNLEPIKVSLTIFDDD